MCIMTHSNTSYYHWIATGQMVNMVKQQESLQALLDTSRYFLHLGTYHVLEDIQSVGRQLTPE